MILMKFKSIRWLSVTFLCSLMGPHGWSQGKFEFVHQEAGTPYIRNYSPKEYQAAGQNWAIVQDKRGVMYFGNNEGLLEYDGVSWRKIKTSNHTTVRSLAVDSNGIVYVGANGEFGYLAPDSAGQLKFISLLDKVPADQRDFADVWEAYADKDGVYFNASSKLLFWDPVSGKVKIWNAKTSFHSSFFVHNTFFVNHRQFGLVRVSGDSLQLIPDGERFAQVRIYAMLPYDDKKILISTREKGLFLYDGVTAVPFHTRADSFLLKNQVYHGIALHDGYFVLATQRGGTIILDRDGQIQKILDESSGLQDDYVRFVFSDAQDGLWLALNNGIARVEFPSPLSIFTERSGFNSVVTRILRHHGRLFIATGLGAYYLDSPGLNHLTSLVHFKPISGIASQSWHLLSVGNSLLAGTSDGVYDIKADRATVIPTKGNSFFLYRSRKDSNRVYVGRRDGLATLRYRSGQWVDDGEIDGINEEIRTIVETKEGDLWLGTLFQGLLRVSEVPGKSGEAHGKFHYKVERFGTPEGLPKGGIYVFTIAGREIFTSKSGLFRYDKNNNYFLPDSIFGKLSFGESSEAYTIKEDSKGNVWINVGRETVKAIHQNDGSYKIERLPYLRFSEFEVLSILPDDHDIVWLGGADGLIRYDLSIGKNYEVNFHALIRKVSLGGDSAIFNGYPSTRRGDALRIPYRYNSLRFEFSAPSFDDESANQFQYILEGFDNDWSAWTRETKKDYTNIPEGKHRFRLRAKNIYEHLSREDAFEFIMLPPWYRTWWAYGLYSILIFLTVLGIVKWRAFRLENEKRALEQLVAERTHQLKHQTLELAELNDKKNEFLGIAAHDLRNPLGTILGFSELIVDSIKTNTFDIVSTEKYMGTVIKVVTHMSNLLNNLLDISAIEAGKVNLKLHKESMEIILEECEKYQYRSAFQKNITLEIRKDSELPLILMDKTRITEVVANLLSNAIKYTYPGGRVRVYCEVTPSELITHIEDNGQGMTDDDLTKVFSSFEKLSAKPTAGEKSTGLGLAIVKKIVELHNGRVWVKSKQGTGSTFSFSLPIEMPV